MSYINCDAPYQDDDVCPESVEMIIIPRTGDIGNFNVHRALPFKDKRMVGPFIFWDQMGPGEFVTGQGVDVRPHPHIGLSTLTYLFNGSMDHKDSLGNDIRIHPGELNLMTAGSGIVHSERTGADIREQPSDLFGIQSWMAQPKSHEDGQPDFIHFDESNLPIFKDADISGRVILGGFQGEYSPVHTQWDTLYLDICLQSGACTTVSKQTEERALYIISGNITIGDATFGPQRMLVLKEGSDVVIRANTTARFMVLGGAAMDGERYIWWNFVSSSQEKITHAKRRWKNKEFPNIPSDREEFIPLPKR